jgi:hypothetical protein
VVSFALLRGKSYKINHKGSQSYAQSNTKGKNQQNMLFQKPHGKEGKA